MGARVAVCTHFSDGGKGATDLAEAVVEACEEPSSSFTFLYPDTATLKEKIETVATKVYGAGNVEYTADGQHASSPTTSATASAICRCASPRPTCRSRPTRRSRARRPATRSTVREVRASVGAGFVYPICGDMRTMPGLGTKPAASIIDFDENGEIVGLS